MTVNTATGWSAGVAAGEALTIQLEALSLFTIAGSGFSLGVEFLLSGSAIISLFILLRLWDGVFGWWRE